MLCMQSLGCWYALGQRSGILPIKVNTYINTVKREQFPSINLQTGLTATPISSKVSKTSLKLRLHAGAVPLQWMEVPAFAHWLTPPWLGDSSLLTKTLQPGWWIAVEITDMPWYHYGISRSAWKKKGLKKKLIPGQTPANSSGLRGSLPLLSPCLLRQGSSDSCSLVHYKTRKAIPGTRENMDSLQKLKGLLFPLF